MAAETLERREVLRFKAMAAPTTADETNRTIELGIASEANPDGFVLRCTREAVTAAPVVNVLLDHRNETAAIAGRLLSIREERGQLIGVAQFTDAPAAEVGWQLARAGCPTSVRAQFNPDDIQPGRNGGPDVVTKWRLAEVSLVAIGADPLTATRSLNTQPTEDTMTVSTEQATEATPTAAEIRRARTVECQLEAVLTCAPEAARAEVRRLAETEGLEAARAAAIDARAAEEMKAPTRMGSYEPSNEAAVSHQRAWQNRGRSIWANPSTSGPSALAEAVQRAWERKAVQPLWLALRAMGHQGRNGVEVMRAALSTSDLPLALTGSGNRQLLAQFASAPQGARIAATVRQLADYRDASTLDVGLVGKAQQINEGGEIKFGSASEQAATYRPTRHGLGLTFTPESLANDDLAGLDQAINELGAAMLEAEAEALAELLEGNALGGSAPDGKRLFHADHANTVGGPLGIASLGDAVAKLRRQTTVGGRFLYQEPGAILCSPDIELIVRQLLSDTLQAAEPANVNPWRNLEVAVDPQLGQQFVYLLPAGARRPLELGRLTPAPQLESETQFETGNFRVKSEHAFGCAVVDHRPIVRLTVAA